MSIVGGLRTFLQMMVLAAMLRPAAKSAFTGTPIFPATTRRLILSNLGSTVLDDSSGGEAHRLRVDRLLDFFKRVAICVHETICAGRPVHAFLLPYAVDMSLYFSGYIEDWRRRIPTGHRIAGRGR